MRQMTIQQMFVLGMKRIIPELTTEDKYTNIKGLEINLGCGQSPIEGCTNLDQPDWNAENYLIEVSKRSASDWTGINMLANEIDYMIPCPDECVDVIHAYHFLEHLTDPRRMLWEMQRVLRPGGVINIVVPHYSGSMAHQDLDHKHTFAIDTWKNTFQNPYYDTSKAGGWKLVERFNILIGLNERNLAIMTQLIRTK